ncbi:MAG: DUF2157 domain-containing protein [Paludibacteraceae bacterium]|nr:DUF2157 domain-containing protein [Paludibacteraceae bacterium]
MINPIDQNPFQQMRDGVAPTRESWLSFVQSTLLVIGAGFLLSGIVSFFAYNWDHLHRFTKLGLVGMLLLATFGAALATRKHKLAHQVSITSMSVLVGVFLALTGQIYQTGADAYLLFLSWSVCIAVWVFIANFPPLWLLFFATTLTATILAGIQLGSSYTDQYFVDALVCLAFICAFWLLPKALKTAPTPKWFINVLFIAAATISVVFCILLSTESKILSLSITTLLVLATAIVYGWKEQNLSVFTLGLVLLLFLVVDIQVTLTLKSFQELSGTLFIATFLSFTGLFLIALAVTQTRKFFSKK